MVLYPFAPSNESACMPSKPTRKNDGYCPRSLSPFDVSRFNMSRKSPLPIQVVTFSFKTKSTQVRAIVRKTQPLIHRPFPFQKRNMARQYKSVRSEEHTSE